MILAAKRPALQRRNLPISTGTYFAVGTLRVIFFLNPWKRPTHPEIAAVWSSSRLKWRFVQDHVYVCGKPWLEPKIKVPRKHFYKRWFSLSSVPWYLFLISRIFEIIQEASVVNRMWTVLPAHACMHLGFISWPRWIFSWTYALRSKTLLPW
jgi:hypothetical protein